MHMIMHESTVLQIAVIIASTFVGSNPFWSLHHWFAIDTSNTCALGHEGSALHVHHLNALHELHINALMAYNKAKTLHT